MYCLASGKGVSERYYLEGDIFEFVLKDCKKFRFKGKLRNVTTAGIVVLNDLELWTGNKYVSMDGNFRLGVYDFSEYRKVGKCSALSNFTIVDSSYVTKSLVSVKEEILFNIGENISVECLTSKGRKVTTGILSDVTKSSEIVLRCLYTGKDCKVKIDNVHKVWFASDTRKKYSVKTVNKLIE